MSADGLHHRDARPTQCVAQVGRRTDAVAQVVGADGFAQSLGQGLEVATGQAAVGGEAFGQDEHVAATFGEGVVVERQPAADVAEGVLLRAHRHAVGQGGHLANDVGDLALALALFALVDEPGVLREAAGVEEEGDAVAVTYLAGRADVGQGHWLAAAGVVGYGQHHERNALTADAGNGLLQCSHVHVALEGQAR